MQSTIAGLFCITVLALGVVSYPLIALAEDYQQIAPTEQGTVKVGILIDPQNPKPGEQTKLKIDFLNSQTNAIQEHIDYTVTVAKGGTPIFGPIQLTHTSNGHAIMPIQFKDNGIYQILVTVEGILFQPIPQEKANLTVQIGQDQSPDTKKTADKDKTKKKSDKKDVKKKTKAKVKKQVKKS
jgi:hypothetical protein